MAKMDNNQTRFVHNGHQLCRPENRDPAGVGQVVNRSARYRPGLCRWNSRSPSQRTSRSTVINLVFGARRASCNSPSYRS